MWKAERREYAFGVSAVPQRSLPTNKGVVSAALAQSARASRETGRMEEVSCLILMKNEWNNRKVTCMHTWISHSSGRGSASAQRIAPRGLAQVLVMGVLLTSVLFFRPAPAHAQAQQQKTAGQQNSTTVQTRAQDAPGHLELFALGLAPPIVDD